MTIVDCLFLLFGFAISGIGMGIGLMITLWVVIEVEKWEHVFIDRNFVKKDVQKTDNAGQNYNNSRVAGHGKENE